ncbi:hypothetical protein PsorP6_016975 [Peronosclerospora sorghi]|uniref:Uncharacterized protein n=1 Tax=Peronosclerospora sorghi TaxID=230839 RepID=A0ACC0WBK3_9STRA|nr:hypothetical protein PsorP6_016975 [Peronosclerospora sorghi]
MVQRRGETTFLEKRVKVVRLVAQLEAHAFDGHGAAMVRASVHEYKASFRDTNRDVHVMKSKSMRHVKWIQEEAKTGGRKWPVRREGQGAVERKDWIGIWTRREATSATRMSNKSATRKRPGNAMYMRSRWVPDDDVGY